MNEIKLTKREAEFLIKMIDSYDVSKLTNGEWILHSKVLPKLIEVRDSKVGS